MWPFKSNKLSIHLKNIYFKPMWFTFIVNQADLARPNLIAHGHDFLKDFKLQWMTQNNLMRVDLFSAKHLFGRLINQECAQSFFLFSHLNIEQSFESLKALSLENAGSVTAIDLSQEGRAIEWLRVSFKVLKDAIESCRQDDSKVVQAKIFLGQESKESRPLFRAIIFNLDITCLFDPQGVMGVVVFDDKNSRQGSSQKPVLEASFKGLKPAVLDELITLTSTLMSVVEEKSFKSLENRKN